MAYMTTIFCIECKKEKHTTVGSGSYTTNICHDCQKKEKDSARKAHFAELDKLTLEQRIRRIEEILYDKPWSHTHSELVRY